MKSTWQTDCKIWSRRNILGHCGNKSGGLEERSAGSLVAADLTFTWPQGRGCVTVVSSSNTDTSFIWEGGTSPITCGGASKSFHQEKSLRIGRKCPGSRKSLHLPHKSIPRPRVADRSAAKALPFIDHPLWSAPGLGPPTGTKHMDPCATTPLQGEASSWMGDAPSAWFCSIPSQLQVWSGFQGGKSPASSCSWMESIFRPFAGTQHPCKRSPRRLSR